MQPPLTPEEIARIRAAKRRRKERRERTDEALRQQQDDILRRIADARARKKRFLLWLLMAMLMTQMIANLLLPRHSGYRTKPAPKPPRRRKKEKKKEAKAKRDWQPTPENDFAPRPGSDDYCDGYSRAEWDQMAKARGWRQHRTEAIQNEWTTDPQRSLFPARYQDWDHRPSLFELAREFSDPYQRSVAFDALKIVATPEVKDWLEEAYALDPGEIRRAFSFKSSEIAENFKASALRWQEQKRKDHEEAMRCELKAAKAKTPPDDEDTGPGTPSAK
ncbi:HEAT repeat domain-containing protein [Rhizobium sp. C4]|uniref:HEAT repeat domain-containing protein n=1 Tax=Rhizobium sp. C4 TaxID=1349800 RepID=UPI001E29D578|nr:HEAT repeat domain-containing protein [Rhizobium sp. C4]MCD2173045.1 hypothetical protein [Rhizobium sp. C4]